jgi:hypothetical protein
LLLLIRIIMSYFLSLTFLKIGMKNIGIGLRIGFAVFIRNIKKIINNKGDV